MILQYDSLASNLLNIVLVSIGICVGNWGTFHFEDVVLYTKDEKT
jgi:hypothetical protein